MAREKLDKDRIALKQKISAKIKTDPSLSALDAARSRSNLEEMVLDILDDPSLSALDHDKIITVIHDPGVKISLPINAREFAYSKGIPPEVVLNGAYNWQQNTLILLPPAEKTPENLRHFRRIFLHELEHYANDAEIKRAGCPDMSIKDTGTLPPLTDSSDTSLRQAKKRLDSEGHKLDTLYELWQEETSELTPKQLASFKRIGALLRTSHRYAAHTANLEVETDDATSKSAFGEFMADYHKQRNNIIKSYPPTNEIFLEEWVAHMAELELPPEAAHELLPETSKLRGATHRCLLGYPASAGTNTEFHTMEMSAPLSARLSYEPTTHTSRPMLTAGTHPCVTPHYHSDAASNLLLLAVILRTFGVPIEMRAPAPVFPEHTLADAFLTPPPQYMIAPSLEAQRTEADLMREMVKTEHRGRKAEERAKQQQLKWQSRTKHSHSKYGGR